MIINYSKMTGETGEIEIKPIVDSVSIELSFDEMEKLVKNFDNDSNILTMLDKKEIVDFAVSDCMTHDEMIDVFDYKDILEALLKYYDIEDIIEDLKGRKK